MMNLQLIRNWKQNGEFMLLEDHVFTVKLIDQKQIPESTTKIRNNDTNNNVDMLFPCMKHLTDNKL